MSILNQRDRRWFGYGAVTGFVILSIALASVPKRSRITDDTAIYQKLSEINVPREASPNFDRDIQRLSDLEPRYREKLPLAKNPKLQRPLDRISKQKYRYTGATAK
jgi:hypothetical protein